jgi:tRNA nucleotidyltransferase (CCA-adding enzyme)
MRMASVADNLAPLVFRGLSPRLVRVLERAGRFADAQGWKAYLVGGSVRDLLLSAPTIDLDILVEGHGLDFARDFARSEKGVCKFYRRFSTALVILPGGIKVDVTTTRSETYPRPGALPEVLPSSLEEDLRRRDFTINALAVSLNRSSFGSLTDVCGGRADLEKGVIRVLHADSFRDDPTRIFRAVRFRQRLGFAIEPETVRLIRSAVDLKMFEKVSAERLRRELELIFAEAHPARAIESMSEFDQLRFIHPRLGFSEKQKEAVRRLEADWEWFRKSFPREKAVRWWVYFGALVWPLDPEDIRAAAERFALARDFVAALLRAREREADLVALFAGPLSPGAVHAALTGLPSEILLILMARSAGGLREGVRLYLERLRMAKPRIGGADLSSLGLAPGPRYAPILSAVLRARLDGKASTREEELALARSLIDKAPRD